MTTSISDTVAKNLSDNSTRYSELAKTGGSNFAKAEKEYMAKLSGKEMSEQELQQAQVTFQRASRVYSAITEMLKSIDQMIREVIRNLAG